MAIQVSFFETYTSHDLLGFYTLSACSASCPAVVMWWFTSQAFLVFTSAVSRLCLYPCSSSTVTWECTRGDAVWLLPFALVTVHALSACCSLPFLPLGISSLLGLLLHGCREVPLTSISLITCCCSHFICFTSLVSVGSYLSHCTQQFIPYWRILLTPFITWQLQQLPFSVTKINDYAVCSCSYSVSLWSCHHTLLSHLSKWLMMGIVLEKLQWTE